MNKTVASALRAHRRSVSSQFTTLHATNEIVRQGRATLAWHQVWLVH